MTFVAVAVLPGVFARSLARPFVRDPAVLQQATTFVRIAATAVVGMGPDGSTTGVLRGAGDTRWPFSGNVVGLRAVALPIAYLRIVSPVGSTAVYVAFVLATKVRRPTSTWSSR